MSAVKCVKIEPNNEIDKLLYEKYASPLQPDFSEFGEDKTVLCSIFKNMANQVQNMEVFDSDTFVITYPKSGTTWCQEMVWMISNNLDFEGGKLRIFQRFPFLEFSSIYDGNAEINGNKFPDYVKQNSIDFVNNMKKPRFIKSHLPWELLPKQIRDGTKKPKIIYVIRNAKDVCVSYYYHSEKFHFKGSFNDFANLFLAGRVICGSIWDNIYSYWKQRNKSNILILNYEDMKTNLPSVIRKSAKFLNKSLTEDQMDLLVNHLSFESMKKNKSVNYELTEIEQKMFIDTSIPHLRSGTIGSYQKDMTPELIEKFDEWIKENVKKFGLPTDKYLI